MSDEFFEVDLDASELEEVVDDIFDDVKGRIPSIMSVVAAMLVTAVDDRIDSEGGGSWEPHAASTVAKVGAHKLMQLTGVLAASVHGRSGTDFAEATTGVSYIVFHIDGGPIIPKRNPFELDDDVLDEVEDFVLDQIGKAAAG